MADHRLLARALITVKMNGLITSAKFPEMIMSQSLLLFISCVVAFKSVQSKKNGVVILATCKKNVLNQRLGNVLVRYTAFYRT